MWCPSVSLAVWGNAWLAGRAAPDDVLDALAVWTPTHAIAAHDAVAAGHTGLPSPGTDAGSMSLLATLGAAARDAPAVRLVLPVPGDVRGLPAGTPFQRDALDAGEAVIITGAPTVVGLVPEPEDAGLRWTAYALPTPTDPGCAPPTELATAEYELRSAVRSAVDALGSLGLAAAGTAEPRELVEQMLDDTFRHRVPDHAPARALRVLEQAAHVDAILAVAAGPAPIGTQSFSQTRISDTALRSLAGVVRTARLAAVDAILRSAWG